MPMRVRPPKPQWHTLKWPVEESAAKPNILKVVIVHTNVARPICEALLGKEHSYLARMVTGVFVMATGVVVAKYFGHSPNEVVAHLADGVGYGIHGLGLTPFIEFLADKFEV